MPTPGGGGVGLEKLTRRHGVKLCPTVTCSVEDCSLAIGEIVGYDGVKSASRMNNGVVIFLDSIDKVSSVVERGVVIQDTFVQVVPLVNPAKKVVLSKVPPFISNEMLQRELARHGQLMSPIKLIPLGCKSPHLKHVVSFRRQVFMILKNNTEELNLMMKFRVDDFDYIVYASSERMKCFGCGMEGHLIRSCPQKRTAEANDGEATGQGPEQTGTGAQSPQQENTQSSQQGDTQSSQQENTQSSQQEHTQSSQQENTQSSQQTETGFQAAGPGTDDLGAAGSNVAGSGGAGSGAAGLGVAGLGVASSGATVSCVAGSGVTGIHVGVAGSGAAGSGVAGSGAAGSGVTGMHVGAAGSGAAGSGIAGSGAAGSGAAGSGIASSGAAGSGAAGSGAAGSGAAGSGVAGSGAAGSGAAGSGAVVEVIEQSQEAECFLEEESEMLVDEDPSKDNDKKRKTDDVCQSSSKVKKASPQTECLQSDESEDDEGSEDESLPSSQTWAHKNSGYSFMSIKKFLEDNKGARNVKIENVFPDLQLFLASVKAFLRSPGVLGEKAFTDQETYRLRKLVLKVRKQLGDDEYV